MNKEERITRTSADQIEDAAEVSLRPQVLEKYIGSEQFTDPQDAVFLSIDEPDQIESILKSAADGRDIRLMVVTDSEGILDRGDWGVNGADVSVEKLMVYTAAAGIDPKCVMPVVLDCGTDNEALLGDYFYLGNHHKKIGRAHV